MPDAEYHFETIKEYGKKLDELTRKRSLVVTGYCYGEGRGGYKIVVKEGSDA